MNVTAAGVALLHCWESCRLTSYLDSGGVWTIGWGTTKYPDGRRVGKGETCSQEQADTWFRHDLTGTEAAVDALTVDGILPRHFDALCCFAYNVGKEGYRSSTMRKLVNANPTDLAIRGQFMRWHFDNGAPVQGLWNRRHSEADFYFGVSTPCPEMPR